MRKSHTKEGEQQVVEEFEVYRPIVMANIGGVEDILDDRCIKIILEKSEKRCIVNLMEIFDDDVRISKTMGLIREWCRECSVEMLLNIYISWNKYVSSNYNYTHIHTIHTLHTIHPLFEKLRDSNINGRELEISFPLLLISMLVDEVDITLESIIKIMEKRREEHFIENWDISLYDFLSQEPEDDYFHSINELTKKFGQFLNTSSEDLNTKWMGLALKRLNLVKEKKRRNRGIEVRVNFKKAKDKIRMFK